MWYGRDGRSRTSSPEGGATERVRALGPLGVLSTVHYVPMGFIHLSAGSSESAETYNVPPILPHPISR
jgi:hypothetical protein